MLQSAQLLLVASRFPWISSPFQSLERLALWKISRMITTGRRGMGTASQESELHQIEATPQDVTQAMERSGTLRIVFCFLFIVIWSSSLLAQNHFNISQFTHETGKFFTQPGKWRGNDWLKLGLITGTTIVLMPVDQPIRDAILRDGQRYYHSVPIEAGRIWGEWYTPPIIAGAFGLQGLLAHNATSKEIGFEIVQAVVYSDLITEVVKFTLGRSRPYENEGAFFYRPFNIRGIGFQSLPGGHNTAGWAMSTVLSRNARSNALKILAYVPATLTLVSRSYQDKHWTSDDFLGAAIGVVVGNWVVNLHGKRESVVNVSASYPPTICIKF